MDYVVKKMLYTLKKQRQRARIKEDPVCLAEAHRKDRERKKERKRVDRQGRGTLSTTIC